MKKSTLSLIVLTFLSLPAFTQSAGVSINETGSSPHPSAILDVSSTEKGALIPRMSTEERDAILSPATGLQIFNTTTSCFNYWTGGAWKQICGECDFGSPVANNNGPICAGDNLILSSSTISGATYSWVGPNGFTSSDQNPVINSAGTSESGTYTVTATLNGCTSTQISTNVIVHPTPSAPSVSNDGPACLGSSVGLSGPFISNATYSWAGPDGFSSSLQNPVITDAGNENAGEYALIISLAGCASPLGTTNVSVFPLPDAGFTFNPNTAANNTPVSFTPASGGLSYEWTFANGSPSASTSETPSVSWVSGGTHAVSLTVTDSNGCEASASQSIEITEPIAQTFQYTGSIVNWQVPAGVTSVVMEAWGAQGGNTSSYNGGLGAYAKGTFSVTPGQSLKILVGGHGQNGSSGHGNCGGGGGGSFISTASNSALLVAGGGGGAGTASSSALGTPDPGQAGTSGTAGKGNGLAGGSGGNAAPGVCGGCGATNGAGFFTNSLAYNSASYGTAAIAFVNGGNGSSSSSGFFGGFGGGGAGAYGAGGGGGYSGGGSGNYDGTTTNSGGGGGGSFNSGTNPTMTPGVQSGDGQVVITY